MDNRLHYWMYAAGAVLALFGYTLFSVVVLIGAVVVHHQTRMEQQRAKGQSGLVQGPVQLPPLPQPDAQQSEPDAEYPEPDAEHSEPDAEHSEPVAEHSEPVAEHSEEEEEFTFSVPESSEYGWNHLTVYPTKKRYEQSVCYGGPPTWFTVGEYDVRVEGMKVFIRVVEQRRDDLSIIKYEVVNGTVLRQRPDDSSASIVNWHELTRPEKYFILSRHVTKDLFVLERGRLQKGFAAVKTEAEKLGAVPTGGPGFISYDAPEGSTEEQKTKLDKALGNLLSATSLERFGISRDEFYCQLDLLRVLDEVLDQGDSQRQTDR
jgi:hypothetical protein